MQDKAFVYPLAELDKTIAFMDYRFAQYTSTEKSAITKLLTNPAEDENFHRLIWRFMAGYFDIDPDICKLLIPAALEVPKVLTPCKEADRGNACRVITASPWANGYQGSRVVSVTLPAPHTLHSHCCARSTTSAQSTCTTD
ncbi:CDP-diacylglycerol--glycerol-3-phosphate 3-phosphatidyltransferase [Exophiala xenobiotica]|nr:CDP-diacylglycerol--glycerol-3-phosphate 3-phosphatidyltransferase [Exophiala xenobiotica]